MVPPRDFGAEQAAKQALNIDPEWVDISLAVGNCASWESWIQMGRPDPVI